MQVEHGGSVCESVGALNYSMPSPLVSCTSADGRTAPTNTLLGLSQKANLGWCRVLIARGAVLWTALRDIINIDNVGRLWQ